MTRLGRLLAPAVVCAVIGVLQLLAYSTSSITLRGGLVGQGLYSACLQLAFSVFVVAVIDDWREGSNVVGGRMGRREGWLDIARRPVSFSAAFPSFYLRPLVPVALLAFGTGVSVSALVVGGLPWRRFDLPLLEGLSVYDTELTMAAVQLLVAVLMVLCRAAPRATAGAVVGFGLAAVSGELLFHDAQALLFTGAGWAASTSILVLVACGSARSMRSTSSADTAIRSNGS